MPCLHWPQSNPLREGKWFCFQSCQVIFCALCFPPSARGLLAQPSPAKQGCTEQRHDVAGEVLGQGEGSSGGGSSGEALRGEDMGINTFTLVMPRQHCWARLSWDPPDSARWNSCLSHLNSSSSASPEPCPAASCSLWVHTVDFPPQWKSWSWWGGGAQRSGWVGQKHQGTSALWEQKCRLPVPSWVCPAWRARVWGVFAVLLDAWFYLRAWDHNTRFAYQSVRLKYIGD